MTTRLLGVLLLAVLCLPLVAASALAVEQEGSANAAVEDAPQSLEEIGTQDPAATEFLPEPYQEPTAFPPIKYAVAILAGVVAAALALAYLRYLPKFAQDRQKKKAGARR